jgi:hypothetical protein
MLSIVPVGGGTPRDAVRFFAVLRAAFFVVFFADLRTVFFAAFFFAAFFAFFAIVVLLLL